MKEFKENKLILLALSLVCIIFFIIGAKEVYRTSYLYSYDPGFHMNIAKNIDSQDPLATKYYTYNGKENKLNYSTSLRIITVAINQITGIPYLDIYRLFGLFCRIFTVLTIYIAVKYLIKSKIIALLVPVLFLSSYYVFFRSIITFPENLVIPFHILIFYDVIRAIRENKTPWTLPIFFAASLLIHYRSIVIPCLLVGILVLYRIYTFIKAKRSVASLFKSKVIVRTIFMVLLCIMLSFPVLGQTINQYKGYWKGNIGEEATFAPETQDNPRYNPTQQKTYIHNMGMILSILLVISLFLLFYRINIEKIILLAWLGLTFILTRGTQVNIYVPSDRMLIYFIIPSVIVSSYFLFIILMKYRREKITAAVSTISMTLIVLFVSTIFSVHGWQGVSSTELNACAWINDNISSRNSVIFFSGIEYIRAGIEDYSMVETKRKNMREIFVDGKINNDRIIELYPGKSVYLTISKEKEENFGELEYNKIFENSYVSIYKII